MEYLIAGGVAIVTWVAWTKPWVINGFLSGGGLTPRGRSVEVVGLTPPDVERLESQVSRLERIAQHLSDTVQIYSMMTTKENKEVKAE